MLLYSPTAGVVCAQAGTHPAACSPTARCACVLTPFYVHAWPRRRVSACVDTAACVCTGPASLQGVCAHVQRQSGSGSCAQPCCRDSVCVCACTSTSLHCGSVCVCMCACTSTSVQGVCVCAHKYSVAATRLCMRAHVCMHKHGIAARAARVHAQARHCKVLVCEHAQAQHRCKVRAQPHCSVCAHTACAHACARALCWCTHPLTPPMGADEPQGAPSPAFPPSAPPAAAGIDGSGGSPKVTPQSTRHPRCCGGAVLPPAPTSSRSPSGLGGRL